jgi:hypothetical protein
MFKVVRWFRRNPALSLAPFRDRCLAGVQQDGAGPSAVTRLVLSFSTGEVALGGKEAPFDLMAVGYFERFDQLAEVLDDPSLRPDGALLDASQTPVEIVAEETLMAEREGAEGRLARAGQLKVVRTVFKRHDLTNAQFKDYWLQNHSRLKGNAIGSPGVKRIVATFAIPGERPPEIDGMVELYFENIDFVRKMFAGSVPGVMRKDEENFVQMDAPAVRVVTEEYVVRG